MSYTAHHSGAHGNTSAGIIRTTGQQVVTVHMKATIKACKIRVAQWKPINLAPYRLAYEVSNTGQVRRIGKQVPIRSRPIKGGGYMQVELSPPAPRPTRYKQAPRKRQVKLYVHRLVALTFVPNPDGKPYVNHKDGCKPNNHAGNLEWVTMEENNAHAVDVGLTGMKRGPYYPGARSPVCKAIRK